MVTLDHLESLARGVTSTAPWSSVVGSGTRAYRDHDYMCAASPDVVLKLLAVARAAQELVSEYPRIRQGRQLSGPLVDALSALEASS